MRFAELRYLIRSDLWRYSGKASLKAFLTYYLMNPGFRYSCWLRLCGYMREKPLYRFGLYQCCALRLMHYTIKYGISIPDCTKIGSGLFIGHFGGIVVNGRAVIGRNCSLSHGVTLGKSNRGKNRGYPTVGDNVYFGPGAKVIGCIRVGDNVAIGANSVVTKDVPDGCVAAGVPARVISDAGSEGYVTFTDYPGE